MSSIVDNIISKAKQAYRHIVLPEGQDERIVAAARIITDMGIAKVTLIVDRAIDSIKTRGIDTVDIRAIDTAEHAHVLYELRKAKGMTLDEAQALIRNPLYLGCLMVELGEADGMVAGAVNSTGDVLRPALQIIRTASDIKTVSSCFVMVLPESSPYYNRANVIVLGDCAINPNPTAQQLADIAIASYHSAKTVVDIQPRLAMLSFSTKGSAKHVIVDKVIQAVEIVRATAPYIDIDGELQADAALVESVAQLKAPDSQVAGRANVLIFPDLQSGNIGYKLVQRLAGAQAIGPICQGFNKPVNDLSRGCSTDDIVNVVAITALQAVV